MVNQNQTEKKAALESQQVVTENSEKSPITYVIVRDGHRVSDREYTSTTDEYAVKEWIFWKRVANKHSYGEPVNIIPYDSRKHRVW